jgi:hypothetical protein
MRDSNASKTARGKTAGMVAISIDRFLSESFTTEAKEIWEHAAALTPGQLDERFISRCIGQRLQFFNQIAFLENNGFKRRSACIDRRDFRVGIHGSLTDNPESRMHSSKYIERDEDFDRPCLEAVKRCGALSSGNRVLKTITDSKTRLN